MLDGLKQIGPALAEGREALAAARDGVGILITVTTVTLLLVVATLAVVLLRG